MKAIELLERTLEIFINMKEINLIPMKKVSKLKQDIEIFLDDYYRNSSICETEYEELDNRVRVLETFFDSIQSIYSKESKNLS